MTDNPNLVPADDFWKAQHEAAQRDVVAGSDEDEWFVYRDTSVDLRDPSVLRIRRLLVANRGEIARRIFRTAHQLGVQTIAVFSDPDRNSAHVRDADVAVSIGGSTSAESYLDTAKILEAARTSGADAIHPGYGFLSENPDFAQAVIDAGMIWVGPTPASIRLMALKVEAKRLAAAANVPLVPGAEISAAATDEDLLATGHKVGFPLLVKASAGGGGKGMRTVGGPNELIDAVAGARREAQASFGDPTVFFERYLIGARHVEVQVFGDSHGNVIHLFERECSIQRRHQKIVEESPSPGATPATLAAMYDSAVGLASAINYEGAGTVEFLVAGHGTSQEYFFLEMNTRLQVEHPVTECVVLGLDLVRLQLLVAQGELLPMRQSEVVRVGHAIEVRLYAEDPGKDYLPSTGTVFAFSPNNGNVYAKGRVSSTRDERSVEPGDEVSQYYDPMIAKIISHGSDRRTVARNLAANLRARDIAGITTNRDLLVAILESEPYLAGDTSTDFLEIYPDVLTPALDPEVRERHLIAAAVADAFLRSHTAPWGLLAPVGWRNVQAVPQRSDWQYSEAGAEVDAAVLIEWSSSAGGVVAVQAASADTGFTAALTGHRFVFSAVPVDSAIGAQSIRVQLELDSMIRELHVTHADDWVWVFDGTDSTTYQVVPRFVDAAHAAGGSGPSAPVPGTVVAVNVAAGDVVDLGQTLLILEAMKMEHRIVADAHGVVREVLVAAGDSVDAHQLLVMITSDDDAVTTAINGNQESE